MNNNILHALSEKSFLYLWLGEVFTVLATNIFNFLLILIVFNLTQSNTAVSGVVLSFTIPAIIFGSIAGGYVDRWNKKKVLLITNIARSLLIVFLIFHLDNLYMIYFVSFVVTIFTQFFIPAEIPIIPLVVKKENLLPANALFSMAIFGSILVAFILAGPLIIYLKSTGTLFLLALMFLIGAGFISFISLAKREKKPVEEKPSLSIVKDLHHTLGLISRTKDIYRSLLFLALAQILILILATIAPGYASQVMGINTEEFPLLFVAPAALGTVLGAVMIANIFHNHSREKVITAGVFLSGIAMLFLPYGSKVASRDFIQTINASLPAVLDINIIHIMVVLAVILGVANSLVFVPANTILQENTTDEVRGKMYGILNTIVGVLSLLPIILVGVLSDIIKVGPVLLGIGICLLVIGFIRSYIR